MNGVESIRFILEFCYNLVQKDACRSILTTVFINQQKRVKSCKVKVKLLLLLLLLNYYVASVKYDRLSQ